MNSVLVAILSLGLGAWRLSSLLVTEEGPFGILAKFRSFIGVRYDELSKPYSTNVIADIFTCIWCASMWIGIFFSVIYYINAHFAIMLSLPFAISAVAIVLEKYLSKE